MHNESLPTFYGIFQGLYIIFLYILFNFHANVLARYFSANLFFEFCNWFLILDETFCYLNVLDKFMMNL